MKRKTIAVLTGIMAILIMTALAGCAVTEGTGISAGKGTIAIKANPTTGFDWYYTADNEGIIKLTKDDYSSDSPGLVGGGGVHSWTYEGVKQGTVKLTFKYYRSWEGESTAIETRLYTVTVGDNGMITNITQDK